MTTPLRVLVFFPKTASPQEVKEGLSEVEAATEKKVLLVDSLSWYECRFSACGGWESWAIEAATGKSYRDKAPYFNAFVVLGHGTVGQATARVIDSALGVRKKVYWLSESKLVPVTRVEEEFGAWAVKTGGRRD